MVPIVASEELVPAVTRERDGHLAAGELGDEVRRDRRRIGEGLVVHPREKRDDVERILRSEVELRVVRPEVTSDGTRVDRFVIARLAEANREGPHRSRGLRLHQRDDSGGVDAAGQERAERHVGVHSKTHRFLGERARAFEQLRP
jgi:hypothetical protein